MPPAMDVPHRSRLMHAYAAASLTAGVLSACYLGWSMLAPLDGVGASRGLGHESGMVARIAQDVRSIGERVSATEEQSQAIIGRLASLEERTSLLSSTAAVPGTTDQAPASRETSRVEPSKDATAITTGAILQRVAAPTASATAPTVSPSPAPKIEISLDTSVPPPPAPPKPVHAIQLATAPNLDALRLNWTLLSERHRQLLGALQTRYRQTPGRPNAPYQLIAGPVRSTGEAARICKELATSGVTCRATSFSGEAL